MKSVNQYRGDLSVQIVASSSNPTVLLSHRVLVLVLYKLLGTNLPDFRQYRLGQDRSRSPDQ